MVKVLFTGQTVIDMKETGRTTKGMVKVLLTGQTVKQKKASGKIPSNNKRI